MIRRTSRSTPIFVSAMPRAGLLLHGFIVVACMITAGCGGNARIGEARGFPMEKSQVSTANIQVIRRETEITLTNTTSRSFAAATMWINRQFSRPIDSLEIGETITLPLSGFRNEHGEAFRAGGFFATEKPDRLVQAQIETEDGLVGLIVVGDR